MMHDTIYKWNYDNNKIRVYWETSGEFHELQIAGDYIW